MCLAWFPRGGQRTTCRNQSLLLLYWTPGQTQDAWFGSQHRYRQPPHGLRFKKIMKIHQLSLWGIIQMTHFMGCLFVAGSCSVGPAWYKLCSPGWPRAILLLQPPGCWDSGVSPRPHTPQVLKHTHEIRVHTYLKAPYSGLYQQTNEQGVKSKNHRMLSPKSTALEESTQNQARHPKMFRNSVTAWTVGSGDRMGWLHQVTIRRELQMKTLLRACVLPVFPWRVLQTLPFLTQDFKAECTQ